MIDSIVVRASERPDYFPEGREFNGSACVADLDHALLRASCGLPGAGRGYWKVYLCIRFRENAYPFAQKGYWWKGEQHACCYTRIDLESETPRQGGFVAMERRGLQNRYKWSKTAQQQADLRALWELYGAGVPLFQPTPFGAERAAEIWEQRGPAMSFVGALDGFEEQYVHELAERLDCSFASALVEIMNGNSIRGKNEQP